MRQWGILLIIIGLMLGSLPLLQLEQPLANAAPPPDNEGGTNYGTDWNITGKEYRGNQTIILDGNLTVEPGGNLTLYNVTLIMNCSYDGEYYIEVLSGGAIRVLGESNITSASSIYHYMFWVRKESKFTMMDSELHECGYVSQGYGLKIECNNTYFSNNTISLNFYGIRFITSSNNKIINSTISDNSNEGIFFTISKNNLIENCTFSNNYGSGIYLGNSASKNAILNSTFTENSGAGITLEISSKNKIKDCNISNNEGPGIYMVASSLNNITNCNLSMNKGTIHREGTGIFMEYSTNNTIDKCNIFENTRNGICLENSNDNIVQNCNLNKNGIDYYQSINLFYLDNVTIKNCNISDNFDGGISLHYSKNVKIIDCELINNSFYSIDIKVSNNCVLKNNIMDGNYFDLKIDGVFDHDIDTTNTIKGKPVYYLKNQHDIEFDKEAGFLGFINSNNVTVSNLTLTDSYYGMLFVNTSYSKIENVNILNNYYGIFFLHSQNNTINNSLIQANVEGMALYQYSDNNHINNCIISLHENNGLEILYSKYNNISHCDFTHNSFSGISIDTSPSIYNTIYQCNISNNLYRGVFIGFGAGSNSIINCKINSNGYDGILTYATKSYVRNCVISNNSNHGISIFEAELIIIKDCYLVENNNGIYFSSDWYYYSDITIDSCNISNNAKGIVSDHYQYVNIKNCLISDNIFYGIELRYSENFEIINNTLKGNKYGLMSGLYSFNNNIYHNNFVSNSNHAIDMEAGNHWYNPYPECGNYWDDYEDMWIDEYPILDQYSGVWQISEGRDCIGDVEYDDGQSFDLYPFMFPDGWLSPQDPVLLSRSGDELNTTGSFTLFWQYQPNVSNCTIQESTDETFSNPTSITKIEETFYEFINKPDGTYYYRAWVQNLFGNSSWSNIVKVIVDRVPTIPSGLIIEQILTGNELKIDWNENNYDTINYTIWSNKAGVWKPFINITHPGTEFIDTNLTDGIRYYYKLQAWDARGLCSGFTSVASNISIDKVAPSTPANFKITEVTTDTINLSWSPSPEPDLVGYHIFKALSADGVFKKINIDLINGTSYVDSGLSSNTTYFYKLLAYDEVPNYSYYTEIINETTLPILDLTNPTIISYLPNGTNVFPYPKIKVTFSEFMNKDSVNKSFSIIPHGSGEYSWSIDDRTFTFDPDEKLTEGQTYNVTISTKAIDLAGNPLLSPLTWNFTIGDYTAPGILDHSPNGTEVPVDSVVEIKFNEELDGEYITTSAILLKDQNGSFVNGTISYENLTLTFTPTMDLEPGSTYAVLVNKLLKDPAGNDLGTEFSWEFTTVEEPTEPVTEDEEPEKYDYSAVGIGIIILIIIIIVLYLFLRKSGVLGSKPPPKLVWDDDDDLDEE